MLQRMPAALHVCADTLYGVMHSQTTLSALLQVHPAHQLSVSVEQLLVRLHQHLQCLHLSPSEGLQGVSV